MDETPAEDSLPVKVHNAYTYKRNTAPGVSTAEAEFANDDFEVKPLDRKTAAIVAQQKFERAKAKADKAAGIRPHSEPYLSNSAPKAPLSRPTPHERHTKDELSDHRTSLR